MSSRGFLLALDPAFHGSKASYQRRSRNTCRQGSYSRSIAETPTKKFEYALLDRTVILECIDEEQLLKRLFIALHYKHSTGA